MPSSKSKVKSVLWNMVLPVLYRLRHSSKQSLAPLKSVDITFIPKWRYSACGLPIGPTSASLGNKTPYFVTIGRVTPPEACALMPETAQMYLHFYYGLYDRDVNSLSATYGGSLLEALEFLHENWRQLARDIRHGMLTNFQQAIPDDVYNKIKQLAPNPRQADRIENAFADNQAHGVVKRLWPRMEFVLTVITGSQAVFERRIKRYLGPEIAIVSSFYGACASIVGRSLCARQDEKQWYTIAPSCAFFEFIPDGECSTLFLDQLETGKCYQVVVSSALGYYRYRLGDLVRVVDYFNNVPVVEFCGKVSCRLDVCGEKTSEDLIMAALDSTKWPRNGSIVDFSTTESTAIAKACPGYCQEIRKLGLYYVVFVEIDNIQRKLDSEEVDVFDKALCNVADSYKSLRLKGAIEKPQIFSVQHGTFSSLKRFMIDSNGAAAGQYKPPHYTSNAEILNFLYQHNIN